MKEPVRLRDTSEAARALLRAGKLEVPRAARQRALAFTGIAASVATTGTAAAAATGATSLVKAVVVWVCFGTVGGGLASLAISETLARVEKPAVKMKPAQPRGQAPSKAPVIGTTPPRPLEAIVEPSPASAPSVPSAAPQAQVSAPLTTAPAMPPAVASHNSEKPRRASSLFDEQRIIESARAAVSRGDARSALVLLDGYQQAYAQGQFGPEALALRVQALSAKGDHARARSLATEFQRRHPHHPLLPSVQAAAPSAASTTH